MFRFPVKFTFLIPCFFKIAERVCDTVYEPQFTAKDDFQCIVLRNPSCHAEDRTVIDKTCRSVTNFDCSAAIAGGAGGMSGSGSMSGSHVAGGDYGSAGSGFGSGSDYSASGSDYSGAGSSSGSAGYGTDSAVGYGSGYGDAGSSSCKKTHDTRCYTTPRTVTSQKCEDREEKGLREVE